MIHPDDAKELYEAMAEADRQEDEKWEKAKEELKGLIHPKYFDYAENHDGYRSIGIFEIEETNKRSNGYPNHRHCIVKNWDDHRLFLYTTNDIECYDFESEYEGEEVEYWVWQTTGYEVDDYSGYLLFPMSNGKYWMVWYSC